MKKEEMLDLLADWIDAADSALAYEGIGPDYGPGRPPALDAPIVEWAHMRLAERGIPSRLRE